MVEAHNSCLLRIEDETTTEVTSITDSVLDNSYDDDDLNDELVGTLSEMSDKDVSILYSEDELLDEYGKENESR